MNIVVSLNANYLRPLCVMLRSLLDANPGEEADVYVLQACLSREAFSFARSALPDGRLRLFDVRVPEDFMADAPVLFHFPKEMYYRIFSARLLPQTLGRALYLDPDMVINRPLAPLYGMELGEHFFAAARSVNPVSQVEYKLRLDMPEESEYFNSGVLLMNLDALRAGQDCDEVTEFIRAHREKLILPDQDVLNAHCEGRVTYLPYDWNVMIDCANRIANVFSHAPAAVFDAFNDSRGHEKIVHYAGFEKPWKMTNCDRFELYWEYAPFRERLMALLWKASMPALAASPSAIDDHECAVSDDSPLRKIIDPIAPFGTARREVLKSIGRAVQGKK